MVLRLLLIMGILAAIVLGTPAPAPADGDPASDVLLAANVFYPYEPSVSSALMDELNGATAAAGRAHAPIKVALIASPTDLGVIPQLLGKPQEYADFLDQEISFNGPEPLLVVMADGYGTAGLDATALRAVSALPKPAGRTSNALAAAALNAVDRVAAAEGHPISTSDSAASPPGSSSASDVLLGVLVATAVSAAAAIGVITLRRRNRRPA